MPRILFFDDRYLHVVRHAQRCMGRARMMKDTLYGDISSDIFANIPSVIYSDVLGKWLMLTYGMHLREFYDVIQVHESADGLHWSPLDTTESLDLKTRRFPNQLFELGQCGEYSLYRDELADAQERFKLLAIRKVNGKLESCMFFSCDGLHWVDQHISWHPFPPDLGPLSIWRNEARGTYVIATRPAMVDRRISLIETADWKHFNMALGAFGFVNGRHDIINNQYVYVPAQENFRHYIEFMAKIYAEGLLDNDIFTMTTDDYLAKVLTLNVGSTI